MRVLSTDWGPGGIADNHVTKKQHPIPCRAREISMVRNHGKTDMAHLGYDGQKIDVAIQRYRFTVAAASVAACKVVSSGSLRCSRWLVDCSDTQILAWSLGSLLWQK